VPGRGYAAYVRQDAVALPLAGIMIDVSGPINQGDISLPVSHNTSVLESWNLVGNPYPSSIDWDDASWTKTSISATIAVRDNGAGSFLYWDGANGGITNGVIATAQGFWVRTTASAPIPQLTVREAAKSTTTGAFFRDAGSDVITMTLAKGDLNDKAYFKFRDGALYGLDEFDAPKLVNDRLDFSTRFSDTSPFAINAVNELPCGTELYLDLRFTKESSGSFVINPEGNYDIAFEIAGTEFRKYNISLLDKFTGDQVAVNSGFKYGFTITSDPASMASDRLKLHFEGKLPTLDLNLVGADVVCGTKDAAVIVKNSDEMFEYFLLNGDQVLSSEISGTGADLSFTVSGSVLTSGSNKVKIGVKGVCGTEFLEQTWNIIRYEDVSIAVESGDILVSNYTTGNQWYYNNQLIPDANNQNLKVEKSGIYKVEVVKDICSSSAEINYVVTSSEEQPAVDINIYPNPFSNEIHIRTSSSITADSKISVLNNLGQEVINQSLLMIKDRNDTYFSLGHLPDGMYFIKVKQPNGVSTFKVIKNSK
jgi:trimeric autotransporter adhesin